VIDHSPKATPDSTGISATWNDSFMRRKSPLRVKYDRVADAAYIYLTAGDLSPGRVTVAVPLDDQERLPEVILDFKDGRLVGVEVLGARDGLPADLLGLG
jgi:uncharacterized protein YuzE